MCLDVQEGNAKPVHAIGPKIFQSLNCLMIDFRSAFARLYGCVPNTKIWYTGSVQIFYNPLSREGSSIKVASKYKVIV